MCHYAGMPNNHKPKTCFVCDKPITEGEIFCSQNCQNIYENWDYEYHQLNFLQHKALEIKHNLDFDKWN